LFFDGERKLFIPFDWYGGAILAIPEKSPRVVSLSIIWRLVVSFALRLPCIPKERSPIRGWVVRRGGEETSQRLGTVCRRNWVQDVKLLRNKKMGFVTSSTVGTEQRHVAGLVSYLLYVDL
jgi:hypothetical protein